MKLSKINILIMPAVILLFLSFQPLLKAKEIRIYNSDKNITEEVQNKIRSNLYYTVFDWVTVETNDGVVTLRGYTDEPWDKSFFEKIAGKVEGVKSVNDKIEKITGSDYLRFRALHAIYGNSLFERYRFMKDPPVHIIIISNRIILIGTVSSELEKDWATNLIEWRTNAFGVENNLTVEKT